MSTIVARLTENLAAVEQRIGAACARVGRSRDEVTLLAVTKTVSPEVAALLPQLGILDLGESRPQQLWQRAALLPRTVRWHLIGHLQRNKIERTLPLVHRIHSVDSVRLLQALEATGRSVEVFLECNCSGEASKDGFAPQELANLPAVLNGLTHVRIVGLMTMAAYHDDPEQCRPTFALLRQLRDRLRPQLHEHHPLKELSMGMSNDYEVAIEEGSTVIRLGTVLFAGLDEVEP
jgi:pyridoxal phosphate enzyme (YggS family)